MIVVLQSLINCNTPIHEQLWMDRDPSIHGWLWFHSWLTMVLPSALPCTPALTLPTVTETLIFSRSNLSFRSHVYFSSSFFLRLLRPKTAESPKWMAAQYSILRSRIRTTTLQSSGSKDASKINCKSKWKRLEIFFYVLIVSITFVCIVSVNM